MKRLLLVEDDTTLGETLQERLQKESYIVTWVATQKAAQEAFQRGQFDLIILDVGLPDGSGFAFAREVRASSHVPFIFVTAMNSAEYRLEGYELGAEEFIPKPFHLKELLIRIQHVLQTHAPVVHELDFGDRTINFDAMTISYADGRSEPVAKRDFQLLRLLISSSPRVLSRDEILNEVWGEDKYPSHRTVDNSIVRLRQLLGDSVGKYIRSVRGIGYQWLPSQEGEKDGE